MANIKEPVTAQHYILKYAIVEQLQQLEEDSRLTTLPKPLISTKLEAFATLWHASNYIKRITILN